MKHMLLALLALAACQKEVPKGLVEIDSGSAQPWQVLVDGQSAGTVEPFGVLALELPVGQHEVRISGPQGEVEHQTIQVDSVKVTIVNPGARNRYILHLAGYGKAASGSSEISGQRVMQFEGSLTRRKAGGSVQYVTGTANSATVGNLYRKPPESFTPEEAMAYLRCNPDLYSGDNTEGVVAALRDRAVPADVLTRRIESDSFLAVRGAFHVAAELRVELPEEKLLAWLRGKGEPPGPPNYHTTPDWTRCEGAAIRLAKTGRKARVEELLPAFSPAKRSALEAALR